MIKLTVYDREGKETDHIEIDESVFGGKVRPVLLKQALVMYHTNKRVGTAATKSRGMVSASNTKLYRQKGTGRARAGRRRTVIRKGGGVAFAKKPRSFNQRMPRKQRLLARNSAILAKIQSNNTLVIDTLEFNDPKTREFAAILHNLNIDRSCLLAMDDYDINIYKSLRNIPRIDAVEVDQLNAGDICNKHKLLFTRKALEALIAEKQE
ncbi:MAG: 50S ribosomal protein L4 [Sedimentisphaerales bacterium]|nr:50S ribosomal protein L4 [Sedimentisphaerales bacterium]